MLQKKKEGKIDKVMKGILKTQYLIYSAEKLSAKKFVIICLAIFALFLFFAIFGNYMVSSIFGFLLFLLVQLSMSIGWHSSVRRFMKMLLINLVYIAFILVGIFFSIIKFGNMMTMFPIFAIIYFSFWLLLSILAKSDIAKLVNEILSAFLSIVFTVGTYIMGIALPKHLPSEVIDSTYRSIDELEQAIMQDANTGIIVSQSIIYWLLENLFLYLLPFICVTIMSMTAISIKQHWLHKHPEFIEIWDVEKTYETEVKEQ